MILQMYAPRKNRRQTRRDDMKKLEYIIEVPRSVDFCTHSKLATVCKKKSITDKTYNP